MPVISGGVVPGPGRLLYQSVLFTETSGAGVYTGSVTVPAAAFLVEVGVHGIAVWDNAGTVGMIVGDVANDDGILVVTSLKAAGDLVAGETLAAAGGGGTTGGEEGADIATSAWSRRYLSTERVISGVITTSSTGGSTGRTLLYVIYTDPVNQGAATKV